ncbi:heterokaryon incompatibility protein-domain-containing protein [Nemania sp. NC0429]|nr:heterokaryon incompatibility protein-domain-containing protein [Nemania sp. NC0429]
MTRYSYRSLQDDQFRLVELIPGQGDLRIRLHERNLNQAGSFAFLSYIWGANLGYDHVQCDGSDIPIGETLSHFLFELRRRHEGCLLFIDAICINQENNDEKEVQISMLSQINRKATSTFCWVDARDPDRVSRLVGDLCRISRLTPLRNDPSSSSCRNYDPCLCGSKVTSEQLRLFQSKIKDIDLEFWEALNTFLGDMYFERTWVSIDWFFSKQLVFICRSITISGDELCLALGACFRFSFSNRLTSIGFFNLLVVDSVKKRCLLHQVRPTLHEILSAWHSCRFNATDERDKLFALLNIVYEGHSQNDVKIDYSKTKEEIYLQAAAALGVKSLYFAKGPRTLNEASWVPDWNTTRDHFLLSQSGTQFAASPATLPDVVTNPSSHILHCRGIVADRIKKTSSCLPPRRPCDHYIASGANSIVFDEWFEFVKDHARRSRGPYDETKLLFRFAETIQARGANTIWETEWDEFDTSNRMRGFLEFLDEEDAVETLEIRLFYAACFPSHGQRFGITERGYYCLLPQEAKTDDLVCIVYGNNVPILLRRHVGYYQNLGECYVNGLMHYDPLVVGDCQEVMFNIK